MVRSRSTDNKYKETVLTVRLGLLCKCHMPLSGLPAALRKQGICWINQRLAERLAVIVWSCLSGLDLRLFVQSHIYKRASSL